MQRISVWLRVDMTDYIWERWLRIPWKHTALGHYWNDAGKHWTTWPNCSCYHYISGIINVAISHPCSTVKKWGKLYKYFKTFWDFYYLNFLQQQIGVIISSAQLILRVARQKSVNTPNWWLFLPVFHLRLTFAMLGIWGWYKHWCGTADTHFSGYLNNQW